MTLRFRNRFTAKPVQSQVCKCGRLVSREVSDGRETIIHELPWCDRFRELMQMIEAEGKKYEGAPVEHHVAIMEANIGGPTFVVERTAVIADGDSPADVEVVRR